MAELLAAERLEKSYGSTQALAGASLSVAPGDVYALIGPNGEGKTTLVQCLTGTTGVDSGTVTAFGVAPQDVDESRVGYLPQEYKPHDRLTARELVEYYAGLYRDAREVDRVLSEVGVLVVWIAGSYVQPANQLLVGIDTAGALVGGDAIISLLI